MPDRHAIEDIAGLLMVGYLRKRKRTSGKSLCVGDRRYRSGKVTGHAFPSDRPRALPLTLPSSPLPPSLSLFLFLCSLDEAEITRPGSKRGRLRHSRLPDHR